MPQAINVTVIRAQLTRKLEEIDTALTHNLAVMKEENTLREEARAKFAKEHDSWKAKTTKDVAKAILAGSIELSFSMYNDTLNVTGFKKSDFDKEPGEGSWYEYQEQAQGKLIPVPEYYDARGNRLQLSMITYHLQKALDLLDTLPVGTAEITIKDFSFLTRY
jgi:hypothetical protein